MNKKSTDLSTNPESQKPRDRFSIRFPRIWPNIFGVVEDRSERLNKRFESFLNAVPYDYCGWNQYGTQAVSPTLFEMLDVRDIRSFSDLKEIFRRGDRERLDDFYNTLCKKGKAFRIEVGIKKTDRIFEIIGNQGRDIGHQEVFNVLWFRDVTERANQLTEQVERMERLKQSETLLRSILNHVPYPVWMRDADLNIVWCNVSYAQAFSENMNEIIKNQREMMPGGKSKKLAAKAKEKNQKEVSRDHVVVGGERRFAEITETPVHGDNIIIGAAIDMTEMENIQAELNRYSKSNREVLEQLNSAVIVFDTQMRVEFFNSSYKNMFALTDKFLDSKPKMGELFDALREKRKLPEQSDFRRYLENWKAMFTSLLEAYEEMQYLPDGTTLRMLVVPHPDGGLMVMYEDVTSRLELESSYNTLMAVQNETIDNLAEGISVFGSDGRLKLCNPAYQKIWHFETDLLRSNPHITELVELTRPYFFDADDKKSEKPWQTLKEKLIKSGLETKGRSGRLNRKDGTVLKYSIVPLPNSDVLVSYVDITDSVRVEQALLERNAALEEAERLKMDFLANVSYQLRTPLNAMMGFADVLDKQYFGTLNDKQTEYTKNILEAGHRLVSLVDDILDLSTIEAGYLELSLKPVSIYDLMETIKNLTEDWARKQNLQIIFTYAKSLPSIEADERRLKQIMINIIQNAINFSNDGSEIHVSAKKQKDDIVFTIEDSGVGISKDDMDKIFEPFVRTNKAKLNRGAGIGLSLVRSIIELHQGTVKIDSVEGKGTKVVCSLPIKQKKVKDAL